MFTGLISEIGVLRSTSRTSKGLRLVVHAPKTTSETLFGESISINGACQTVVEISGDTFGVDTVPETLDKTTLGNLIPGNRVNLEQAIKPTDRLGGHIVSGHIDCTGSVRRITRKSSALEVRISFPDKFADMIVPQGSIAVDGISLTVADLDRSEFAVAVIPTTLEMTTLSSLKIDSIVNIEFDLIGKYIVKFLSRREAATKIDEQYLKKLGF